MYARAEPVSLRGLSGLRNVCARLLAGSEAALLWSGLLAPSDRRPDDGDVALPERVRLAALIVFAGGLLLLPIEILNASGDAITGLLLVGGLHLVLTSAMFLASYTATGLRQADLLAVLVTLEQAFALEVSLCFWPAYPGLTTGAINCVLVGTSVLFSWRVQRVARIAAIVTCSFAVVGAAAIEGHTPYVMALGTVGVGAAISVGVAWRLEWLRTTLARRRDDLTALTQRLMSVQEEERRRLARELHDEFGQTLTAAIAYLWLVDRRLPEGMDELRKPVGETRRLMSETLGAMREMSHLLRPAMLDDFGLLLSLDSHVRSFAERYDVVATFEADELPERLPPDVETALYRIAQEALTNVARHARASRVEVRIAVENGYLRLSVADDGVGLGADHRHEGIGHEGIGHEGIGLIGIRERVRALHGTVAITSTAPGFRVDVCVPLCRTVRTALASVGIEMQP